MTSVQDGVSTNTQVLKIKASRHLNVGTEYMKSREKSYHRSS